MLIEMMPGKDRLPWYLCAECWAEGTRPFKLGRIKVTGISDPHLYKALVAASERTAGLINQDAANEDLGRKKKRARTG